ncbi:hypothetical protein [Halococcus thailandensis]|uniref:Uncharacterized protein n=1 Tax=Halococcus thailandensis JCM 13552 TaxID=1227457 RepID=M0MUW1_9EURY|nr:hypothetical protein [Halococcus thailandensis]EMA48245.1 hypothetical protein C451_20662 [Halococcus thailandensis JCM 13552]
MWDDTLYRIVCALGCTHDDELFIQPIDINEVFATLPRLDRWRGFFEAHYGRGTASTIADSSDDHQSTDGSIETDHSVEIGAHPAARADQQRSLDDCN